MPKRSTGPLVTAGRGGFPGSAGDAGALDDAPAGSGTAGTGAWEAAPVAPGAVGCGAWDTGCWAVAAAANTGETSAAPMRMEAMRPMRGCTLAGCPGLWLTEVPSAPCADVLADPFTPQAPATLIAVPCGTIRACRIPG